MRLHQWRHWNRIRKGRGSRQWVLLRLIRKRIKGGRRCPLPEGSSGGCSSLPTWPFFSAVLQFWTLVNLAMLRGRRRADWFGGRGWPVGGVHGAALRQHLLQGLETGPSILHRVAILGGWRWTAGRRRWRRFVVRHVYAP